MARSLAILLLASAELLLLLAILLLASIVHIAARPPRNVQVRR